MLARVLSWLALLARSDTAMVWVPETARAGADLVLHR
jgi:hypothetical protein